MSPLTPCSELLCVFIIFCVLGPGDKGSRPAAGTEEAEGENQEDTESKAASSPLKRSSLRAPAVSSMMTFNRR